MMFTWRMKSIAVKIHSRETFLNSHMLVLLASHNPYFSDSEPWLKLGIFLSSLSPYSMIAIIITLLFLGGPGAEGWIIRVYAYSELRGGQVGR